MILNILAFFLLFFQSLAEVQMLESRNLSEMAIGEN